MRKFDCVSNSMMEKITEEHKAFVVPLQILKSFG